MSLPEPGEGATLPVFDAARHLDAMAPVLGLTITDEQRPVVLQFLGTAAAMARIVMAAPIPADTLDLGPVFRPGHAHD